VDTLNIPAGRLPDGEVVTDAEVLRGRAIDSTRTQIMNPAGLPP